MRKHPNSHREAKATAPVLDSTLGYSHRHTFRQFKGEMVDLSAQHERDLQSPRS
jgi:hypothetical protein